MALDAHRPLWIVTDDLADCLQCFRRFGSDVCFVEVEENVRRQLDANLGFGFLDLERLHFAAEVDHRENEIARDEEQIEHLAGTLLSGGRGAEGGKPERCSNQMPAHGLRSHY